MKTKTTMAGRTRRLNPHQRAADRQATATAFNVAFNEPFSAPESAVTTAPTAIAVIADTNTSVNPTSALQPQPLCRLSYLNQDANSAASIFAVTSPSGAV